MVSMRFEGGTELAALLADLSPRLQRGALVSALRQGAEPIRQHAASIAPRSDEAPHVADHLVIGSTRSKGSGASVAVGPARDFEERAQIYPAAQEIGTVHHAPQPFMRPAFDRQAPASLGVIRAGIWHALLQRGLGSTRASGGGVGL